MKTSAAKAVNEKIIQLEDNTKRAKQIANGYFYKWKKTNEENSKLLSSASSNCKDVNIPKSMIISKSLLEVENDKIVGKGTFGSCVKGKYKGISVCLKFFNKRYFVRSSLINEVKAMLSLIPHSSLPLLFGICMEEDPILVTQFIGFNEKESLTLDNFSKRLMSIKWAESCSPEHLFLTLFEGLHAIHLSGLIHNDVKPNNVMVQHKGLHYNAVIVDFGKACPVNKGVFYKLPNKKEKQKYLKNFPHLAPELVVGDSPQNTVTDIYSLGYTIKKVLSDKFGDSVHHLKDISLSCMNRQPGGRPGLNYFIDYLSRKTTSICL